MERLKEWPVYKELTPRTTAIFLFMSVGAFNFGFDNGWWASVLTLQSFIDFYNPEKSSDAGMNELPSTWLSAGSGTANAGIVIGCVITGYVGNTIGRRMTIIVLVGVAVVGIVIQNAIPSFWAITVVSAVCDLDVDVDSMFQADVCQGRMVNSISMGMEANTIPVYMSELAPPAIRGTVVNCYQFWQIFGVITANIVILGSRHLDSTWSFRTVILLQIFIPLALLALVLILPESPRWLVIKGRREAAFNSLTYIRKHVSSREKVNAELDLLEQAAKEQDEDHRAHSYVDCLRGPNRRRTFIAIGAQVLQQLQGNAFTGSYGVIFLKEMGVADPIKARIGYVGAALAGTLSAFYLADRVGRRLLMLYTALLAWPMMWTMGGLTAWAPPAWPDLNTQPQSQGSVACFMLWQFFTTLGWGSCVWITTSEVATAQLRERTVSIATLSGFTVVLLVSYINPFIQRAPVNLGPRVAFIYGSFSLLAVVWVYFMLPDLRGRSLEELDELFQSKVPTRKFKSYTARGVGARITAHRVDDSSTVHSPRNSETMVMDIR